MKNAKFAMLFFILCFEVSAGESFTTNSPKCASGPVTFTFNSSLTFDISSNLPDSLPQSKRASCIDGLVRSIESKMRTYKIVNCLFKKHKEFCDIPTSFHMKEIRSDLEKQIAATTDEELTVDSVIPENKNNNKFLNPLKLIPGTNIPALKNDCKGLPLRIGKTKKFDDQDVRFYVRPHHVIKRIDEKNYQAILNLSYSDHGNKHSPFSEIMRARVKSCMAKIKSKLVGPGGEILEIVILSPEESAKLPNDKKPNEYEVKLSSNPATDMENYPYDIKCADILHETLHQLGLVDEIKTTMTGGSCRAVPKMNTIMGQNRFAYYNTVGRMVKCECSTKVCKGTYRNLSDEKKKLIGESLNPCQSIYGTLRSYTDPEEGVQSGIIGDEVTFVNIPNPQQSLLAPNYFRWIVSGTCPVGQEGYMECAQYAYISSDNPSCAFKPANCSDDHYMLGIK